MKTNGGKGTKACENFIKNIRNTKGEIGCPIDTGTTPNIKLTRRHGNKAQKRQMMIIGPPDLRTPQ